MKTDEIQTHIRLKFDPTGFLYACLLGYNYAKNDTIEEIIQLISAFCTWRDLEPHKRSSGD